LRRVQGAPAYSPLGEDAEPDASRNAPESPAYHKRTELSEEEAAAVARVLDYYIANYGPLSRRLYWTPSGQAALLHE
jgi:hypothetical protein